MDEDMTIGDLEDKLFKMSLDEEEAFIKEFSQSDEFIKTVEFIRDIFIFAPAIIGMTPGELRGLVPYIKEELAKAKEKPDFRDGKFRPILEKAKENIEKVNIKKLENFILPTDKANNVLWKYDYKNQKDITNGFDKFIFKDEKLRAQINVSKGGKDPEIYLLASIDFSTLPEYITKDLTMFDKRVYTIVANLYYVGNRYVTATQIFKYMYYGSERSEKSDELEKIRDSLKKMMKILVNYDNKREAEKYGKLRIQTGGMMLSLTYKSVYINGKFVDTAFYITDEPILFRQARERSQITTIDLKLLNFPISKTELALKVDDYLQRRISQMKNDKNVRHKILYSTIYEECGATTRQGQANVREKVISLLDFYKTVRTDDGKHSSIKDYRKSKNNDWISIVI